MRRIASVALVTAALVAAAALLSGCGGDDDAADAPATLEGSWRLTTLHGTPASPAVVSTLVLTDGRAQGNAGVNSFTGSYDAPSDGVLTFGPLATTRMAGPEDAMTQEQDFLGALSHTTRFTTADGSLVLLDEDGARLARLAPAGTG